MTTDEWQLLAGRVRTGGLIVTGLGFAFSCLGHYVANRLQDSQKVDKAAAKIDREKLLGEVSSQKKEIEELKKESKPRVFTDEQRGAFVEAVNGFSKGPVTIAFASTQSESTQFIEQIRSLLTEAKFPVTESAENALSYTLQTKPPWFLAVIAHPESTPTYANTLLMGFQKMGIEVLPVNGERILTPGQVRVYIGSK